MVKSNLLLLILTGLVLAPSAKSSLIAIDTLRTTTTTVQTIPQLTDTQIVTQNDEALVKSVKDAFAANKDLSATASSVNVNAVNGVVTLSGTVNSEKDKMDFEKTASSVEGVSKVVNNLQVKMSM